jgi:hypothetical protein
MNLSWSKALITCFEKGARAFFDGKPADSCPYHGRKGVNGQRADYWRQGYESAKSGRSVIDERREIRDAQ